MENLENQNVEQDSYKTGSTKPPKNRGGLVAGLLVAVILLAGVCSILGLMNVQLFRMLQAEKKQQKDAKLYCTLGMLGGLCIFLIIV